jgi:hypothetical protein
MARATNYLRVWETFDFVRNDEEEEEEQKLIIHSILYRLLAKIRLPSLVEKYMLLLLILSIHLTRKRFAVGIDKSWELRHSHSK